MKLIYIFIVVLMSGLVQAEVNLFHYNLTPEQIKIIRKLEAKGTVSEETLIKLAKASQKHNEKKNEYVPEHTFEQLEQVRDWAVGSIFQSYTKELDLNFDGKAYMESYPVRLESGEPNMALFNFGLATGDEYFEIDIMTLSLSLQSTLAQAKQGMSSLEFKDFFIELAKAHHMYKFIDPLSL